MGVQRTKKSNRRSRARAAANRPYERQRPQPSGAALVQPEDTADDNYAPDTADTADTADISEVDGAVAVAEQVETAPEPEAPPDEPETDETESGVLVRERLGPSLDDRWRAFSASARDVPRLAWNIVRSWTWEQWLWIGIIALGVVLRFWGLGDKPLHHDESMHAYYSLSFARAPSGYEYDPLLHGPFQFHAVGTFFAIILALSNLFHVASAAGNPWINDTTARIVPALFGVGIVVLPLGLRRELGRIGAPIAALLLAVSPSFVYFSRFLREDVYFNFFMFAMIVCGVRFARDRQLRWLVGCLAATVLAYATFEGTFLLLAIILSFLGVLFIWELGSGLADRLPAQFTPRERVFFSRVGLFLLLGLVGSVAAYFGLHWLDAISAQVNDPNSGSATKVTQLEQTTAMFLLYACVVLAIVVIVVLLLQVARDSGRATVVGPAWSGANADGDADEDDDAPRMSRFARWRANLDPRQLPFVRLLLDTPWEHWFVAGVVAWIIFVALYWVIPPGPTGKMSWSDGFIEGIGKGVWQGLYYWLQQQDVARGGQPPYYYMLLLPLYEQLVVIFGLVGVVWALVRPNRFRVFLVWWFGGSMLLYSWAGEKMPWLSIHILLPLLLLSTLPLNWIAQRCIQIVRRRLAHERAPAVWQPARAGWQGVRASFASLRQEGIDARSVWQSVQSTGSALLTSLSALLRSRVTPIAGAIFAVLLLIPMVHSMWLLSYQDAANGPLEMMVYVQTTPDVDTVMNKINAADKAMYGGQHQLRIWVGPGEEWPFYWYLRDYYLDPHPGYYATIPVTADQLGQTDFSADSPAPDVLLLLPDDAQNWVQTHPNYKLKQYKLRSWFDENYKPLPCVPTQTTTCSANAQAWGTGVGLGNFLSYGSTPPPNAKFDLGKAAGRLWAWLWVRAPLGATNGSYDFDLVVRDGVPIQP